MILQLKKRISNLKSARNELNGAIEELGVLEGSDIHFDLIATSATDNSGVTGIRENGDGTESYSSIISLAQELKHAYQFNQAQWSILQGGDFYIAGSLYDINDEVEGYRRDYAYQDLAQIMVTDYESINAQFILNRGGYDGIAISDQNLNVFSSVSQVNQANSDPRKQLTTAYGANVPAIQVMIAVNKQQGSIRHVLSNTIRNKKR